MTTLLAVAFAAATGANAFHETFARAQTAYAEERYADAARAYEQLVSERVHDPAVFYNLGNAYFRLDEPGLAIANYERALLLAPGMEEARTNLTRALRLSGSQLTRPPNPDWQQSLFFWHEPLAPSTARTLAVVVWIAFWLVLALRVWRPFPYARTLIATAFVGMLLTTGSAWLKSNPPPVAVVIDQAAAVRHGTSDEEGVRFVLQRGDRVLFEEQRGEWVRVRAPVEEGGTDHGWTRASGIAVVGPPFHATPAERLDRLALDPPPDAG